MRLFWLHIQLLLSYNRFSSNRLRLKLGIYYLKKGTVFQVGQPVRLPKDDFQPARTLYISNLFYNYKDNAVTHTFSKRPIKGLSEKFIKK